MTRSRYQREDHYADVRNQNVQGIFYVNGKRVRRKLVSFKDAGLGENGTISRNTPREKTRFANLVKTLWKETSDELKKQESEASKGPLIKALFQDWIDASQATRATGTVDFYTAMANEYVKANGNHRVGDFGLRHVDKLLVEISKPREIVNPKSKKVVRKIILSTASRNIRLKSLKAFIRWATERRYLSNPPPIRLLPDDETTPNEPTDGDIRAVFERLETLQEKESDPHRERDYRLQERYLKVALATGARRGEIFYLTWERIDLKEGLLAVKKQGDFRVKERKDKVLAMPAFLVEYLEAEREKCPDEVWLLDNGRGDLAYSSPYGITVAIRRHLDELGIRARWGKPSHGLRAKWITDRFREGVDLFTIQRGAGHRRIETTLGYISEPDAHLRQLAQNVDDKWRVAGASKTKKLENGDG